MAWGDTYERLTSIANIDESAQYVLGDAEKGFHYSGTSSWGMIAQPNVQTPLYYTLKKGSDGTTFTAVTTIEEQEYYLTVPTSKTFEMSLSETSIGMATGGGIKNATSTTVWLIRVNGNLRAYSSATGSVAYFYKVVSDGVATTTTAINVPADFNTDVHTSTTAGQLTATVSANGTAISGATVTWESSNEDVARIDADGNVTLVAEGTTTITATYAGVDGKYEGSSATYELTVTDSTPFEGGDVTFVCGTDKTSEASLTKNGVTMSFTASGDGTWDRTDNYRLYANKSLTISTETGTITKIAFTISQNNFSGEGYDKTTKEWTGNAKSVTLAADGGQVRFTPVVVTVNMSATPDPTFTISNNEEIAYNATSGSFDFTVNNPVNDGVTTVSENVDWISNAAISGNNVSFTTTVNNAAASRSGVITLTYTYGTNNETVTKEVTVTQAGNPNITNIPDLFAAANSTAATVSVTFNNWVVSGVSTNGKNVFVTDNNGNGFVIFNSDGGLDDTYAVGSILSGTVSCSLKKNSGYAQLTGVSGLTITTGGSVTEASIGMANLAGVNTGALVSYDNLTCQVSTSGNYTNYDLTDGTTTIRVYNSLFAFDALEAGKTYNITGIYQQYNNTKEILPRNADDIVEVETPIQTTITAGTLNHVEITRLYDRNMEDITLGENVAEGTEVFFTLSVDDGYTLENVKVLKADNEEIDLTENQGSWSFTMPNSSVTINATATSSTPATGDQYSLFTGDLVEGDYIIYYEGKAMNTTVTSDRLQYAEVTPLNDVITTDNAAIVWHIAKSGDYWTIYNADADAYAASTGAKNKAQMLEDGTDDKALWTVSGTETYDFVNKKNAANGVNDNLRNNGTYGFACYASTTGGALSLYKKVEEAPQPEIITVSVNALATDGNKFYSTLYYGDKNLKIPAGITASGVSVNGKSLVMGPVLAEDDVIAKGKAVLLTANAAGNYEFTVVADTEVDDNISWDANLLRGNDEKATTEGGNVYYQLSRNANMDANSIGFYWGAENGGAFTNKAHRAYLAVTTEQAGGAKGFAFNDMATGIKSIAADTENGNAIIYNLAGQRVSNAQKGIYIVNGKKVVIR